MIGWPKLGASASFVLRGIIVSNTRSPSRFRTSLTTSFDNLVRESNIVISTPKISSRGFTPASRSCVSTRFIIEMPSRA